MTMNGDLGEVRGLLKGLVRAFDDQRDEVRRDITEIKDEVNKGLKEVAGQVSGLVSDSFQTRLDLEKQILTLAKKIEVDITDERRKRFSADCKIEARIPKPATPDTELKDLVKENTNWRNRAIGGFLMLTGVAAWIFAIWRKVF